jgi:hypothetical protein
MEYRYTYKIILESDTGTYWSSFAFKVRNDNLASWQAYNEILKILF